jgi:integrase
MVRMGYLHGLRVSELCDLRWDQVNFKEGTLLVKRLKGGRDSPHYLDGDELRALRKLKRDASTPFVFESQQGGPVSAAGFRKFFARLGARANMPWPLNPHMLRHACGYALANSGKDTRSLQGYLGHASITHTVRYTEMSPTRFKNFWSD